MTPASRDPNRRPVPVIIHVPSMLRTECGGAAELAVEASTVREALAAAGRSHPGLLVAVSDETGAIRRHVNLFVNNDNIRDLLNPDGDALDTALASGDVVTIMPAVSGG